MPAPRRRPIQFVLVALVIGAGLASRSSLAAHLPGFVSDYAGDALWALMVFLGFGFVFPRWKTSSVALASLAFAFGIEFSQLYQGDWLNRIRATRLGALVLGAGFLWSDLVCYTVGVMLGVVGEWAIARRGKGKPRDSAVPGNPLD